jgi:myo-inositol-1(or 4)-monophosphatase
VLSSALPQQNNADLDVTRLKRPPFKELLSFAHELADRSGDAIRPHFRKAITVDDKGGPQGFDPVTIADKAAETVIRRMIEKRFPDHGMVGEELGTRQGTSGLDWIVDPIDGTRAFIMGLPVWGTLIGLLESGTPRLGMMDQPFTRERVWSTESASYWRTSEGRPRRLVTRPCAGIGQAVLATTHPDLLGDGALEPFMRVKAKARMTRYGGDCYSYCLLAAGFIDCVIEAGLKPFDIVALIPIVEKAGGVITTWDGGPATDGGRIVASGDPHLHDEVLRMLAG